MSELIKKVEEYVIESFTKDGILSSRGAHSIKAEEWLLKTFPEASDALRVAALSHDLEGAFPVKEFRNGFRDSDYLEYHQSESVKIISKFLRGNNVSEEFIEEVCHLVGSHEVGGDDLQNILKDADSLAFFDQDISEFLNRHGAEGSSREVLKEKLDWMYERITFEEAKRLSEPMYKKALGELGKR